MQDLLGHLAAVLGQDLSHHRLTPVSGGDINRAFRLQWGDSSAFLKLNQARLSDMFSAEAEGLQALSLAAAIRVPEVLAYGVFESYSYLLLEYLPLTRLDSAGYTSLGEQMAVMHSQPMAYFGWHRDNTIGLTPQHNGHYADWIKFWCEQRLGRQLSLAAENGYTGSLQSQGEKLLAVLPAFFSQYQPHPALLHGDCWGGNVAQDQQGRPVLFDPACYLGDREADLAMTELFGGFSADFYAAYQSIYPLESGYKVRKHLYSLYHILNHLNLFGSGYRAQSLQLIDRLLAEV